MESVEMQDSSEARLGPVVSVWHEDGVATESEPVEKMFDLSGVRLVDSDGLLKGRNVLSSEGSSVAAIALKENLLRWTDEQLIDLVTATGLYLPSASQVAYWAKKESRNIGAALGGATSVEAFFWICDASDPSRNSVVKAVLTIDDSVLNVEITKPLTVGIHALGEVRHLLVASGV